MKLCALLFTSFLLSAAAQTVTGTIEKIDQNVLVVKGPKGAVSLTIDEKTTIHKGKLTHDAAVLAAGDEIRANYYGEGAPIAVNVSVKVTFKGLVTETTSNHILVRADGENKESVFVYLHPDAKYGISRNRITSGQRVHVVGWDVGNGVVEAEQVAVYETDVPVRSRT